MIHFSRMHLLENNPKKCFIKDPIHESINFSESQYWLYEIVNTYEFQRLLRLKQLSLTFLNFPSAMHTRYSHSLGVYELCNRFIKHFLENKYLSLEAHSSLINIALATALLHDIGHGPLSHVFEHAIPDFNHEEMGIKLISSPETEINYLLKQKAIKDSLPEDYYVTEIVKVFTKNTDHKWIVDLISSDIDVDRLDFLVRDSYYSGVSYGKMVDIHLFIKWSLIHNNRLIFLTKAKNHLEQFLLAREHMYIDLYCNKVSLVYENLFISIFDHIRTNKSLFFSKPSAIEFLFNPVNTWSISDFLDLYDEKLLDNLQSLLLLGDQKSKDLRSQLFGFSNSITLKDFLAKHTISVPTLHKRNKLEIDLLDSESCSLVKINI